ncbi:hypothetical protein [Microcoleus sp. B3-A4]|uniref:hypothetical protein n=1 Tax=Microcoleus sp. B3-A4 TaxID=2818653 RepID=UPI002FD0CB47
MRENAREISRQLLNLLDNKSITQKTGLRVEDIQNLREDERKEKRTIAQLVHLFSLPDLAW